MAIILALVLCTALGGVVGIVIGIGIAHHGATDVMRSDNYLDAVALADDLLKNPDALTLRDRAQKIVDKHRESTPRKDT